MPDVQMARHSVFEARRRLLLVESGSVYSSTWKVHVLFHKYSPWHVHVQGGSKAFQTLVRNDIHTRLRALSRI